MRLRGHSIGRQVLGKFGSIFFEAVQTVLVEIVVVVMIAVVAAARQRTTVATRDRRGVHRRLFQRGMAVVMVGLVVVVAGPYQQQVSSSFIIRYHRLSIRSRHGWFCLVNQVLMLMLISSS